MNDTWVFVGYPIDSLDETHLYIEKGDLFIQRCEKTCSVTDDSVVCLSESELRQLLDSETTFCSECIRHISGLATG